MTIFVPLYSQNNLQCLLDCLSNLWAGCDLGQDEWIPGFFQPTLWSKRQQRRLGPNLWLWRGLVSNMPRWDSHCSRCAVKNLRKKSLRWLFYGDLEWSDQVSWAAWCVICKSQIARCLDGTGEGIYLSQLLPRYFNMVCLPDCNSPLGSSILFCAFGIPTRCKGE